MTRKPAKPSGLDPMAYSFLFHPSNIRRPLAQTWRNTLCFRLLLGGEKKHRDVWTLYKEPECNSDFDPILTEKRAGRLLVSKTQHSNVQTVGPLDFCGTARLVSGRGDDM